MKRREAFEPTEMNKRTLDFIVCVAVFAVVLTAPALADFIRDLIVGV